MNPQIFVVELNESDALLFAEFRRLQSNFSLLNDCGFFGIRNGSGTVHFDAEGRVRKVDRNDCILKT